MAELSQPTQNLIAKYELWRRSQKPKDDVKTIHVDEVASKVAVFYEHIRTIVDWKEEHLMRRAAIIRKIKRIFLDLESNNSPIQSLTESLVTELVRGGFFSNDHIEESKVSDIQRIIEKYVFILNNNPKNRKSKSWLEFYNWLLEVASCEIEETLAPSMKEMSLIDYMFESMKERIRVSEKIYQKNILTKKDADIQIYIAVQQALFKLDKPIISYNLIKYKYPWWGRSSQEELLQFSQNIHNIWMSIERDLSHPIAKKFYNICEKYDTAYLLIGDILSQDNMAKILEEVSEPSSLESYVRSAYLKRLKDLNAKVQRAAVYSTLSIFITKILSLVVLEVILAKLFNGHFDIFILGVDVLIPTLLMVLLVSTLKKPSKKNISLVIMEIIKTFYQREKIDVYEVRSSKKRGVITKFMLYLIYLAGAFISFSAIWWVLNYFGFPLSSIIINIIFIALILFAGTNIQKRSQELTIEETSGGFLVFVSDILFLPVTGMGRWMSNTWKQYNIIIALFNALIDMPFSVFIEFLEGWRGFIKEKKEEL